MNEREEFVHLCNLLSMHINNLYSSYGFSDRVWVSVISVLIKQLVKRQESPDSSMKQFIELLKEDE